MVQDGLFNKKFASIRNKTNNTILSKILVLPIGIIIFIYLAIVILPITAMIRYSGIDNILEMFYIKDNISSIILTFYTSSISLLMTFVFGTTIAFYLRAIKNKNLSKLISIIIELPIVLPPAAVGIALLLTFGNNGFVGKLLNQIGVEIVFTPIAVILAQFFVSSAYYVKVLTNSINDIPKEIFEATYVLGAGRVETVFRVIIPMLKRAIISGLILSFIRSIGEFGATLMFAGNILNETRTIPLQIYTYMQTDIKMATSFSTILYILSFLLLFSVRIFLKDEGEVL
ncbi:ABC transporter permease [Clostridium folliculivorans]|uniref:Molybdenum transport system permease n=1 Tax=Clostridium folliculivorans TaxID=2886038 RepID=A0A9W5Y1J2_9CLOT|nr:ABC transporter permease [Clostridium folliculivorans]GKU24845.1 molybdate ABC transporter permease [Clostridium folliculivorans]GKU30943.1 molybdate ABC transporter permease [Clostridium folliculivorans]